MPHIAVRIGETADWQFVQTTRYPDEAFLRDRVSEEPSLIPAAEIGLNPDASVVTLREVGLPGAGSSDVILINSFGDITVVECKLATNPERKRAVIGQVLDYASSLARLTYDDLDARVRGEHQRLLHTIMEENVLAEQWDEDQFRSGVAETLVAGTFKLVIAIDDMDADLARILHYISSQGALRIFGLEMRYHKQGDVEVIIPHISNPVGLSESEATSRWRVWTANDFRAEIAKLEDDRVRNAASDMLDFALSNSAGLNWGRAQAYGTFGYRVRVAEKPISLFTYYTSGTIYVNLSTLRSKAPPAMFEQFVGSVARLPGFERIAGNLDGYPQFQTRNTLVEDTTRTRFKDTVLVLQKKLDEDSTSRQSSA
jgi:hypothetical protein